MGGLSGRAKGMALSAIVLYALMYAGFSWIKRDPRPAPWLVGLAERRYERLCRGADDPWPRGDNGAYHCAQELRDKAMGLALFVPLPASILIGHLFLILTHLGLGALIIRTSSPLSATVRKGVEVIKAEPGLLTLPALSSVVVSLLLGFVFWKAFSHPRAVELNRDQFTALAWTVILAPPVLAGYFATAFGLLLTNAALIKGYLDFAGGRGTSFRASIFAALRVAPAIATISVTVFGALLILYFAVNRAGGSVERRLNGLFGGYGRDALRFAGFFIESGLLIGAQLVVAAMLAEELGLVAALRRVTVMIKPAGREILTAAFGMATMRHDACAAALLGPFFAGIYCLPLFTDNMALGMACLFGASVLCGSLYFSFLMALEGVFAAGIFAYARGGVVLPGLEKRDVAVFIDGLRAVGR